MNTRSKRASSVGIALFFVLAPPLPDATLDQGDRQHIAISYSGILAVAAVPIVPDLVELTATFTRSVTLEATFTRTINLTVER